MNTLYSKHEIEDVQPYDEQAKLMDSVTPLGFRVPPSNTNLISGTDLSTMSRYDPSADVFFQNVRVEHDDAFTLKATTLTTGPLKSGHALLLEPVVAFRFTDLPPEIRTMVYNLLLQEARAVRMTTLKVKGKNRRPMAQNYTSNGHRSYRAILGNSTFGRAIDLPLCNYGMLRVNKQISHEAAAVAYGNTFEYINTGELNVFLSAIRGMRRYLRHVSLPRGATYTSGRGPTVFKNLLPAMNLRNLTISHTSICSPNGRQGGSVNIGNFVDDIAPFIRALHESQQKMESPESVLNVVHVVAEKCQHCKSNMESLCESHQRGCTTRCREVSSDHCDKVAARLQAMLAELLGIKA